MTEALYPTVTRDLARMRRDLVPGATTAFHDFSEAVFAEGALFDQDQTPYRGRRRACHAMPLLHQGPHARRA